LEFIDENGNFAGFDIELMNAIAEKIGYEVKWENADFAGLVASLQTGKYDAVISAMTITASRQEEVDFSRPYFRSDQAVVVQESNVGITKLRQHPALFPGNVSKMILNPAHLGTVPLYQQVQNNGLSTRKCEKDNRVLHLADHRLVPHAHPLGD